MLFCIHVLTEVYCTQDVYELRHQDGSCVARQVNHYDTGGEAVMNCSVIQEDARSFSLASGQEGHCQLYNLRFKVVAHKEGQEDGRWQRLMALVKQ